MAASFVDTLLGESACMIMMVTFSLKFQCINRTGWFRSSAYITISIPSSFSFCMMPVMVVFVVLVSFMNIQISKSNSCNPVVLPYPSVLSNSYDLMPPLEPSPLPLALVPYPSRALSYTLRNGMGVTAD